MYSDIVDGGLHQPPDKNLQIFSLMQVTVSNCSIIKFRLALFYNNMSDFCRFGHNKHM